MTWLPVVERELRVAARRRATYRIRFWAVLVMLGLFAMQMLGSSATHRISSQAGRELFEPLTLVSFLFAISIGVIATSDSVSEEKREGTLGLLFLTDLTGYDVILGKLVAHSINGFYALVAILPILGMPLLMGGVTAQQFVRMVIALISCIVLSLAAGIFVSTHSRNERKAMVFTFLLLAALTCGPWLLTFWLAEGRSVHHIRENEIWMGLMFSPGFAIAIAMEAPPFFPSGSYWFSVIFPVFTAIVLLQLAARKVPRSWTERSPKPAAPPFLSDTNRPTRAKKISRKLLDENPFLWLAMRGEASRARVWFFVLSIFAIWLIGGITAGSIIFVDSVIIPMVGILHVGIKIWVAGEASRRFVEDRRNNAMEFLLSTPLEELQIIRGQWRALVRQFLGPIVFLLLWEAVIAFCMKPPITNWFGGPAEDSLPKLVSAMFFLPLDVVALSWMGMWLGMTSKGRGRAMITSLGVIVVGPYLLVKILVGLAEHFDVIGMSSSGTARDGFELALLVFFSLTVNLVVIIWSQTRLLTRFRQSALAGFSR